jgi:hypothetical protein
MTLCNGKIALQFNQKWKPKMKTSAVDFNFTEKMAILSEKFADQKSKS